MAGYTMGNYSTSTQNAELCVRQGPLVRTSTRIKASIEGLDLFKRFEPTNAFVIIIAHLS
jgi:hypothetical protein